MFKLIISVLLVLISIRCIYGVLYLQPQLNISTDFILLAEDVDNEIQTYQTVLQGFFRRRSITSLQNNATL